MCHSGNRRGGCFCLFQFSYSALYEESFFRRVHDEHLRISRIDNSSDKTGSGGGRTADRNIQRGCCVFGARRGLHQGRGRGCGGRTILVGEREFTKQEGWNRGDLIGGGIPR